MPSFILIRQPFSHSTPTLQTDRTGQDRTDNSPIAQGEPFYKWSPKNYMGHPQITQMKAKIYNYYYYDIRLTAFYPGQLG